MGAALIMCGYKETLYRGELQGTIIDKNAGNKGYFFIIKYAKMNTEILSEWVKKQHHI